MTQARTVRRLDRLPFRTSVMQVRLQPREGAAAAVGTHLLGHFARGDSDSELAQLPPAPQVKYRTKAKVSQNVIFSMEPKRELVSPAVPRRAVQPPSSHRTLPQPSRMAEYAAAGLGLSPPRQYLVWAPTWDRDSSSVPPASYYEATPWWGATPHTVRLLGVRVQSRTVNTAKEKERFRR